MQVQTGLPTDNRGSAVLALGNFDGVHLGHRRLLEVGLAEARKDNFGRDKSSLSVLVFNPHPMKVLFPEVGIKLLTTPEEQLEIFEQIGVDTVYQLPFTLETASMPPEKFVKDILLKLGVRHVVVGFNYSFGYHGEGSPDDLQIFGRRHGFEASVLPPQTMDGRVISSSSIRKALLHGDIGTAKNMLGRAPSLRGVVVKGEARGRLLGYPTANLLVNEDLLVPKRGVYAVSCQFKGQKVHGMMNIGTKPTFHDTYKTTIEAHFFDFHGDLYGEEIAVQIEERLRDERKFTNLSELQRQLDKDACLARQVCLEVEK